MCEMIMKVILLLLMCNVCGIINNIISNIIIIINVCVCVCVIIMCIININVCVLLMVLI